MPRVFTDIRRRISCNCVSHDEDDVFVGADDIRNQLVASGSILTLVSGRLRMTKKDRTTPAYHRTLTMQIGKVPRRRKLTASSSSSASDSTFRTDTPTLNEAINNQSSHRSSFDLGKKRTNILQFAMTHTPKRQAPTSFRVVVNYRTWDKTFSGSRNGQIESQFPEVDVWVRFLISAIG